MDEETKPAETGTITISKKNLWMYSTFILVALLIVGGIFLLTGKSTGTGGTVVNIADLKAFTENPSLYPSLGPENAKNVVIEFSDFQCPYCAMASGLPSWAPQYSSQVGDLIGSAQKLEQMAQEGKIRFIYVSMSFLDDRTPTKESDWATEAALIANEQGKFWEMHDAIFSASNGATENDGKYSKDNLKKIAAGIEGLDTGKFNESLDSDARLSDVQKISTEASKVATGTPTFYVNGEKVSGSWSVISAKLK